MISATRLHRPLAALALVLALAACNGDEKHQPFTIAVTTPNGEPLATPPLQGFDSPGCPAILGTWFDRIDTNHDGFVDRAEFIADAEAQFARMDLNHDGVVTPGDLQEYRAGFQGHNVAIPGTRNTGGSDGGGDDGIDPSIIDQGIIDQGIVQVAQLAPSSGGQGAGQASGSSGGGSNPLYGKKSRSLADLQQGGGGDPRVEPDPVMSADTSLRFLVTKKDFIDQAARRFARLDMEHTGRLTKQQAMYWCVKRVRWPEQEAQ
jgi:hypothetical protein